MIRLATDGTSGNVNVSPRDHSRERLTSRVHAVRLVSPNHETLGSNIHQTAFRPTLLTPLQQILPRNLLRARSELAVTGHIGVRVRRLG